MLIAPNSTRFLDELENAEHCVVFLSLDALRRSLADAGPRLLSKPVVILSDGHSLANDYLVEAVRLHWRFGGKYVLSRVRCEYEAKSGKLQLGHPAHAELQRIATLGGSMVMPLEEALACKDEEHLFVPTIGFAVCIPQHPLTETELEELERACTPSSDDAKELERLAKMGSLGHQHILKLQPQSRWPIANEVERRLQDFDCLLRDLSLRAAELTVEVATKTLRSFDDYQDDLLFRFELADSFLSALSLRGDILLVLNEAMLQKYFDLCRRCSEADSIASNLVVVASKLCQREPGVIPPLFQFLAAHLSPVALNSTFAFCAGELPVSEEHFLALADSMRSFADDTIMALLLTSLIRIKPAWLMKSKVLKRFNRLLSSNQRHVVEAQFGQEILDKIEVSANITDRFRAAVLELDKARALSIIADEAEFTKVDVRKWMDSLRALSNELRELGVRVSDLDGLGLDAANRQLAAIIFSDATAAEQLRVSGLLDDHDAMNAVALNLSGNGEMLDSIIAEKCAASTITPLKIRGNSTLDVFSNACSTATELPQIDGPLVSVIMSAFNPDMSLMEAALSSVSNQTWRNVEIFVVDDASDVDKANQIARLVAKFNQAELIRLSTNAGPYVGRNLALRRAQGEYIAIQDADDWSHPQRFAAQIEYLSRNPAAQVVASEHIRINGAGLVALEGQFEVFGDGPMTSMFRVEVFRDVGDFAAVCSRGDIEMRDRIMAYYGYQAVAHLPLPLVLCFAGSQTLSHRALAEKGPHVRLFRANMARRPDLNSLRRDGVPLRLSHQVQIPVGLRPATTRLA
ncbi:glycosyltransferase family 2 protein [Sphingomonas piscis]|uniref:Glycosyltransferase family 2 protein n=1 Tax=Sphingomonas piscis TaxID=2714943 RepID=A0A6G7YSG1_9SPHN|nr:glycosyltransferase family A protein [Sphingomonas piscis]QIK79661.1 glycosyltransferase family 2 protein [Sphingomonas piscis]